jgi:tRNA-splicing ligase RtcB
MKIEQISKPHEIFCGWELLDPQAVEQFRSALENPWAVQGALMPDTHKGYALPIGGVVATDNVIVPAWVGYDIGCGMCAVPTTFKKQDVIDNAQRIHEEIHLQVPVGNSKFQYPAILSGELKHLPRSRVVHDQLTVRDGMRQLGTLGGGNHFIEIGYDEFDTVWIIIHSGSRGVGHGVAGQYMKVAQEACGSSHAETHNGLRLDSPVGQMYKTDMDWCLAYALENRRQMMCGVQFAMRQVINGDVLWGKMINRNHNHAEEKDGLVIHRKGATHAEEGMMGVIPGNMRDGSFIVVGKGNPDSICSSSHGAGRVLSRSQAKKTLDVEKFKAMMSGIASDASEATLDESPDAYKPVDEVMQMQKDLVTVVHRVRPLLNVKG